jgi:hypothetical protein
VQKDCVISPARIESGQTGTFQMCNSFPTGRTICKEGER